MLFVSSMLSWEIGELDSSSSRSATAIASTNTGSLESCTWTVGLGSLAGLTVLTEEAGGEEILRSSADGLLELVEVPLLLLLRMSDFFLAVVIFLVALSIFSRLENKRIRDHR